MELRFLRSHDGTQIGYLDVGVGSPLVYVPHWGENIERWGTDGVPAMYEAWARGRRFVVADLRGVGSSQRSPEDVSLVALVGDITALADHLGLEQFDLLGTFFGAAIAMAYTAMNPERVRYLVVAASFACGQDLGSTETAASLARLVRTNWKLATRTFAGIGIDREPTEGQLTFARRLHASLSPEVAARYIELQAGIDLRDQLARITTPTLVLHRRSDRLVPLQAGKNVASLIPDARFVIAEGGRSAAKNPFEGHVLEFIGATQSSPPAPEPTDTAVIVFADIVGSTELTERLGDIAFRERARSLDERLRAQITEAGGTPIRGRTLGDGVLAVFPSARQAIAAARHFGETASALDLALHIGIHAGDVIRDGDDVYGGAVNVAARISDLSKPNEILVSMTVRDVARTSGNVAFEDRGEHLLKGIADKVRLFAVGSLGGVAQ